MSDTFKVKHGEFKGRTLEMFGNEVWAATRSERCFVFLRTLANLYDRKSDVWVWLRSKGLRRPSPSGTPGYPGRGEAGRTTPRVSYRLPLDAQEKLKKIAAKRGLSISRTLTEIIEEIALP